MKFKKRIKKLFTIIILALALGGAWWLGTQNGGTARVLVDYATKPVDQGQIRQTVTANGQLKPINVIVVGSQVSGEVKKMYADFNDTVKKGQLLAEIDASLLKAQIDQSEAQFANTVSATKLAELNAVRNKRLFVAGYIPRSQWETSDQDARTARTSMEVAKAQLDRDRVNLSYAELHSPVDGIVISREVSVGQTLQASFQTPEVFKIATDLNKMQISIDLPETDIGHVKEGQAVEFKVDAFPGESFSGTVSKVHMSPNSNAQQGAGAVTYNMLVDFNNDDRKLLPGMTAYVDIVIAEKADVLRVPSGALRFAPSDVPPAELSDKKRVFVLRDSKPVAVEVETGLVDADNTEITSGPLTVNDKVIVDEIPRLNAK